MGDSGPFCVRTVEPLRPNRDAARRSARLVAPQGRPYDAGVRNDQFPGKRIYIEFDEYVQIEDQQKEFFTSPFMPKNPSLVIKGRGVQIDLQDTLLPNQTYALNFGSCITDNNEGNPYVGLRYVFSTGSEIDSLVMSGYTIDAETCDTVSKSFILYFDPATDSVPGCDSTLYNSQPLVVGRAFPNGIFLTENLQARSIASSPLKTTTATNVMNRSRPRCFSGQPLQPAGHAAVQCLVRHLAQLSAGPTAGAAASLQGTAGTTPSLHLQQAHSGQ